MARLFSAVLSSTTALSPTAYLLEMQIPALVQAAQPGQYCMIRCASAHSADPLLRRPFYLHTIDRVRGSCTFLVYVHGRASAWLSSLPVGASLELLGPLGHGWTLQPAWRNLLVVAEAEQVTALTFLIQEALRLEIGVTLLLWSPTVDEAYPPALLAPEVEYQITTASLSDALGEYLAWADGLCCSTSHETALTLYNRYERVRQKSFSQGTLPGTIFCGTGLCLSCTIETHSGPRLLCREGPVFALRELVR